MKTWKWLCRFCFFQSLVFLTSSTNCCAVDLGSVLLSYKDSVKAISESTNDQTLKGPIESFLHNAKLYLNDPKTKASAEFVGDMADRIKKSQIIINNMRTGGCLNSGDSEIQKLSRSILQGAMTADGCKPHRSADLPDLAKSLQISYQAGSAPPLLQEQSSAEAIEQKINFAEAIKRRSKLNNDRATMFLNYVFGGEKPHCSEGDLECERTAQAIKLQVKPVNVSAMVSQANGLINEAIGIAKTEINQLRQVKVTGQNQTDHALYGFSAKMDELRKVPGIELLEYIPEFRSKHSEFMDGRFVHFDCNSAVKESACFLNGAVPNKQTLNDAEIKKTIDVAKANLESVAEETLAPVEQLIHDAKKRLADAKNHSIRLKTANETADAAIEKLMEDDPFAFGSALMEHPEYSTKICDDILKVKGLVTADKFKKSVVQTGLATLGLLLLIPSASSSTIMVGAAISLSTFGMAGAEAKEAKEKLNQIAARQIYQLTIGTAPSPGEAARQFNELKDSSDAARMLSALSVIGLVGPPLQIANKMIEGGEAAPAAVSSVKRLLETFKRSKGIKEDAELLPAFQKIENEAALGSGGALRKILEKSESLHKIAEGRNNVTELKPEETISIYEKMKAEMSQVVSYKPSLNFAE